MTAILSIKNLNYSIDNRLFFKNFNLDIEKGSYVSIIAPNKSGKTVLTKILCAIIPTNDLCFIENISLNKENVLNYITKIGIVTNDFNKQFLFKKVREELSYPLVNLGYTDNKINKKINYISKLFEIDDLLDKDIDCLTNSSKSKLLIILSLIHNPKVLILDDAFTNMNLKDKRFILNKLKLLNKEGLTIVNITSDLNTIYDSQKIFVLNNFEIEKEGSIDEIFNNDSYLRKLGFEIPFIVDLSLKLKIYGLVDKIYYDLNELEENLWK